MRERWKRLQENWKGKLPPGAVLALAVGCLLLLLPSGGGGNAPKPADEEEAFDLSAFEQRLEQALSAIEGAGETRVVLSLKGGERQVLAQDSRQDAVETLTVGNSAEERVVPIQTVAPVFRGALVVSPGAEDARVRLELTRAVCVLTGLGADNVWVSAGGA